MKVKVLIIEDHQALIEGYKSILHLNDQNLELEIVAAYDCESGLYNIVNHHLCFDMILLDILLPAAPRLGLNSGADLAFAIRKCRPECKLMILTSHTEAFVLYDIAKKINPEGLLVKSDFTAEEFLNAFIEVYYGGTYRSSSVVTGMKRMLKKEQYLDSYNREIIALLARGVKTKSLPQHLNLSISAIDKRKVQIKEYLDIEGGNDEDIIREAKKFGFI